MPPERQGHYALLPVFRQVVSRFIVVVVGAYAERVEGLFGILIAWEELGSVLSFPNLYVDLAELGDGVEFYGGAKGPPVSQVLQIGLGEFLRCCGICLISARMCAEIFFEVSFPERELVDLFSS